jgi:serine/threonine-protein kinase RsbW
MQSVKDSLSVTYEAQPKSVAQARAAVGEFATKAGASRAQVDAVRLATSEAVTNAVLHAYRGRNGEVHLTAAVAGQELWLLVADDGDGLQPQTDRPGLGLGLGLISQVCDEMAIVARSSGGTEVRIRFDLVPAEAESSERAEPVQQAQQGTDDSRAVAPGQLSVKTPAAPVAVIREAPPTD